MKMRRAISLPAAPRRCALFCAFVLAALLARAALAQRVVDAPRIEEKDKAERQVNKAQEKIAQSSNVTISGASAFKEDELRSQLKEQITAIGELGLTAARADDAAFLLELFYRKHGYEKAEVHYSIAGSRLRLEINEGPRVTVAAVNFVGNDNLATDKLFEFAIGPTRERYGKTEKTLPFVKNDLEEGVDLVRRLYISEGYLNAIVQAPNYAFKADGTQVDVTVAIVEGRHYSFGDIRFAGRTVYDGEELRKEMADILQEPYTDRRVADIPRRLQAYYKARGYYDVKVDVAGDPAAATGGRVPVRVTISPGPVYYFDGSTVTGLKRLRPSYVTKRFSKLSGKKYDPKVVDEKFREMMKTGLFSVLQIKPVPVNGNMLHMEVAAEEAKSKEFGLSLGYGTYAGVIVGASFRDRDLFGYGRPLTTSAEYSSRGYKGEVVFEDPYLFDTDLHLTTRLGALTYDFDGYSKFEFGARLELAREITKQYKVGAIFGARHVEVTSANIAPAFLGRTSYQVNTVGYTQTLDLRTSPLVSPRGLVIDNTLDYASETLGSQIEFVRSTARVSYYLPFAKEKKVIQVNPTAEEEGSSWDRWFRRSLLAVGARAGVIQGVGGSEIPIDERFFNGGSNSVRSFAERELGPSDRGNPIGGEFFSVFNIEYTFPIFGELQLAVFGDAGNLLASADDAGLSDMRYAVGLGLRYQLPIGPLRIDYGVNPNPRGDEAFGAFHFSFGFAF
ncbi:MAG TPA: BamA/TamA family outer membrane protein [Chthoniobacterales bacterium]|nr:BamA/TamA family outer membrane protein [Chthoniobacterales bacterium]